MGVLFIRLWMEGTIEWREKAEVQPFLYRLGLNLTLPPSVVWMRAFRRSLGVVWRAVQSDVGESSVIGSVLRPSDE